jgi:hypothetical protein
MGFFNKKNNGTTTKIGNTFFGNGFGVDDTD